MHPSYIVFDGPGASSFQGYPAPMQADDTVTLVTMAFEATDPAAVAGALARYVVLSRGHAGCRNIDLCQSAARPQRFVVVEKWESPAAQRAHLDSPEFTELARACEGLLTGPPQVELLDGLSAHDLA